MWPGGEAGDPKISRVVARNRAWEGSKGKGG